MADPIFFCFFFFSLSLLSLWVRRDPKIWGGFLMLSYLSGLIGGTILGIGLVFTFALAFLWIAYAKQRNLFIQSLLFIIIIIFSFGFIFHLLPGYPPVFITPKFIIGLDSPQLGLFPLALLVPLARTRKEGGAALKGLLFGCLGIAILAGLAIASGTTYWQFKLPTFAAERYWSNLILTAIPEEGFFRGFIQRELCRYLEKIQAGKYIALVVSSLIFTAAHYYWSPNLSVQSFVFLASLLYGGVYLISGRIESAILTHFLLNFIHMTFFQYHAM